jgi:hypothetical protein
METQSPQVFHESRYTYRRKEVLVFAGLSAAAGLAVLWKTSDSFSRVNASGLVIAVVLLGLGTWLLYTWKCHREITSRIDSSGITCDGKLWPWEKISWVSGHSRQGGVQLFFQARGILSIDRHIWSDKEMTEEEYDALITRLSAELKDRFPKVQFG